MTILSASLLSGVVGSRVTLRAHAGRSWIRPIFKAIARHRKASRDYDHLLDMPDFMLNDIGLTRFDVHVERRRHNGVLPPWLL